MTAPCAEMRLLLQAEIDGELGPADSARVAAHVETCLDCAAQQAALCDLARHVRRHATQYRAPEALRTKLAHLTPEPRRAFRWPIAVPFGAGAALAAAVLLAILPAPGAQIADEITADHIRALQPGHLLDVVSTDRHTVKPWFAGKLDFSPTVRDLAANGFPLKGGRLDYVGGRAVAVLVYERRQHAIDVYVWPAGRDENASVTRRNGFNVMGWRQDGLDYWAVSDLDPVELASFAELMQGDR